MQELKSGIFSILLPYKFESNGVLWINLTDNNNFKDKFSPLKGFINKTENKLITGDFLHSIEKFLDPNHTPHIHKGILRNENFQKMKVSQILNDFSFSTKYELLKQQNGLFHKLFNYGININIANFELPGFATLQYLKDDNLIFQIDIFFVPIENGKVSLFTNIHIKRGMIPIFIKHIILKILLEILLKQDKSILETQYIKNKNNYNNKYIITDSDLVIDHLLYLISDKEKGELKDLELEI